MLNMFKRFGLFFVVNILIVMVISFFLYFFGIDKMAYENGFNPLGMMILCLVWGMGGAFISLWISKFMAKMAYGVKIISPTDHQYGSLVRRVHEFARKAGLKKMPEVGVYESSDLNAFATGPSRSNSLVAVSTGLIQKMGQDEVDGVLAHEVAHIANGDMVTMTLIQGVVNAFVMFIARLITFAIDQAMRDDKGNGGLGGFARMGVTMILQMLLGVLGSMVTSWFSRHREFRADSGGAFLAGKHKMIAALRVLQNSYGRMAEQESSSAAMASLQISSRGSWTKVFSTHPDLSDRIATLEKLQRPVLD